MSFATENIKTCTLCGNDFPATTEFFYKQKNGKYGVQGQCIKCRSAKIKEYGKTHQEDGARRVREWRGRNREDINKDKRRKRAENVEEARLKEKEYYQKTIAAQRTRQRKYRVSNQEKIYAKHDKYREANRKKINTRKKEYRFENRERLIKEQKEKEKIDARFKINRRMSALLNTSLKRIGISKNGSMWSKLAGYTVTDLMKHIEKRFEKGMTWENHGEWHIDHIIPRSRFNIKSVNDLDFKKCWALSNLQPLWAFDNLSKNNKLEKPFQPSLAFG